VCSSDLGSKNIQYSIGEGINITNNNSIYHPESSVLTASNHSKRSRDKLEEDEHDEGQGGQAFIQMHSSSYVGSTPYHNPHQISKKTKASNDNEDVGYRNNNNNNRSSNNLFVAEIIAPDPETPPYINIQHDRPTHHKISNTITKKQGGRLMGCSSRVEEPTTTAYTVVTAALMVFIRSLSTHGAEHGWTGKQEHAFCSWINYMLNPAGCGTAEQQAKYKAKMHSLLTHINRNDSDGNILFKCRGIVDEKQLGLTDAQRALKDVSTRQAMVLVVMSYQPLWLAAGMEVVLSRNSSDGGVLAREGVPVEALSNKKVMETFVRDVFLSPHSSSARNQQHQPKTAKDWGAAQKVVVGRFLHLAALLDLAADSYHDDYDYDNNDALPATTMPPLFRHTSTIKSSMEAVKKFLSLHRGGSQDLKRQLARLGLSFNYIQSPLTDLFTTPVRNIAVDFRNGFHLARLAELIIPGSGGSSGADNLTYRLSFPAIRRPVRLANIKLVLHAFEQAGVPVHEHNAAAIIDGDQKETLALMWHIVEHFQIAQALVDPRSVALETERLGDKTASTKRGHSSTSLEQSLLQWTNAVCRSHGVAPVTSFNSKDWATGKIPCLLLHHYLGPAIMSCPDLGLANHDTPFVNYEQLNRAVMGRQQQQEDEDGGGTIKNSLMHIPLVSSTDVAVCGGLDGKIAMLLAAQLCSTCMEVTARERAALRLQRWWRAQRVKQPGGALDNLKRWIQAASVVQRCYRSWKMRKGVKRFGQDRQKFIGAVVKLQSHWKRQQAQQQYRLIKLAAVIIQSYERRRAAAKQMHEQLIVVPLLETGHAKHAELVAWRRHVKAKRAGCAVVIQSHWRGCVQRRSFSKQKAAAVCIQSHWRGGSARKAYTQLLAEAMECRRRRRVNEIKRHMARFGGVVEEYIDCYLGAVKIQSCWRGALARREAAVRRERWAEKMRIQQAREEAAKTAISRWVPAIKQRRLFKKQQHAVMILQQWWKQQYTRRTQAAMLIQAAGRGFLVRRYVGRATAAAVIIQSVWRGHAERVIDRARPTVLGSNHQRKIQLADIRQRLRLATSIAKHTPGLTIGEKMHAAVATLIAAAKHRPESVLPALATIQLYTEATTICCHVLVLELKGLPALLAIVQKRIGTGSTDAPAQQALSHSMCILGNIYKAATTMPHRRSSSSTALSSSAQHQERPFRTELMKASQPLLLAVGEVLQRFRDAGNEEPFMTAVSLAMDIVKLMKSVGSVPDGNADDKQQQQQTRVVVTTSKYEGVRRMLGHKKLADERYLEKLEREKGSDKSAKAATASYMAVTRKIEKMQELLGIIGGGNDEGKGVVVKPSESTTTTTNTNNNNELASQSNADVGQDMAAVKEPLPLGKNTLVRVALKELNYNNTSRV
jgi:abnormal spindle-like microcephaly-associated protein